MKDDNGRADAVARLVSTRWEKIRKGRPSSGEWTVLAGFVLCRGVISKVVSIATGTKAVGGQSLVDDGSVVHDCHAEALCRRGLQRYDSEIAGEISC